MFTFHAEPTSLENLHKYYYEYDCKGVGYIRWDMLAFFLLQGSPYKNVFLAEKTRGIVMGALLMR